MTRRVCCICGKYDRKSKNSFFAFPKKNGTLRTVSEIQLVEKRISAWKAIVGQNFNRYYGVQRVCSDHFHSGTFLLKRNITIAMVR